MQKVSSNIQKRLQEVSKILNDRHLAEKFYNKFYELTPEDTGNAKRSTTLKNNVVEANYQYADVLDKGRHMTRRGMRGSNQAKRGMTIPTIEWIRNYIREKTNVYVKKGSLPRGK